MKFLTNCTNRLAKELAEEQATNELLRSHVDDAFRKLEKQKIKDSDRGLTMQRQRMTDARLLQLQRANPWIEPQHPQVQHVRKQETKVAGYSYLLTGIRRKSGAPHPVGRGTAVQNRAPCPI